LAPAVTNFTILAELSSDALLVAAQGHVTYANPAALALLVRTGTPLTGMPLDALWHSDPLADDGRWAGDRLDGHPVRLRAGAVATVDITARRTATPDGPQFMISARPAEAGAQTLARRVRSALRLSDDAAFVIDAQTLAYLDANPAACALLGQDRAAVLERGPATLRRRDGNGLEDFHALYAELIARSPQALSHDYDLILPGRAPLPLAVTRQALHLDGRWLIFVTWRDIADRVVAQALVQQFKDAFDQTPDATSIVDVADMAYVYFNEPFLDLVAMSRAEVLATGPARMAARIGVKEDLATFYGQMVARHPAKAVREEAFTRPDGQVVELEIQHQAVLSAGRWLVRSTRIDITGRKRQQRHMERITTAFNAAGDAIYVINPRTFEYVEVNETAARLHGMPRDALRAGGVLGAFSSRTDEQRLRSRYADLIARSPEAITEEMLVPRRDGTSVWAESTRRAIRLDDEWLVIVVLRDITERKASQARLELMRQAINAAPDPIVVIDPQTLEYIDVNEATAQMYGVTREQLLARGARGGPDGTATDDEMRQLYAGFVAIAPQATIQEQAMRLGGRDAVLEFTRRGVNVDGRWLIVSVNRDITERKAAEARLETLREAINAAPDAIVIIDPQTLDYIDINEAAVELMGAPRAELMARGARGVYSLKYIPDEELKQVYARIIEQAPQSMVEERTLSRDGREAIIEFTRRAVNVDGRWLIVSLNRDITERKTAQTRIERFAALVNLSTDAVIVVDRDSLRIIDVNEAACRLYRCSREALLARGPHQNRPSMSIAELEALYDETIARAPEVLYTEHDGIRADGTRFLGETHRLAVRSGERWVILATVRDISQRKRAETEIRERVTELELLRQAHNAAVDAIMIADPETLDYLDVNHAAVKLLGVSREDLLAGGVEASYYSTSGEPFQAERFKKGCRYVISRSPEAVIDERTVNPKGLDGRDTVIEFSRRAVNVDGRWVIVTLMRDITASRRAEEEIRQRVAELTRSNQELEQFAYVTSHDLSEPLRMVASYTQLLRKRYGDKFDEDGREFMGYVVDGAQRMKQLIDDLLTYSRAGRTNAQMRPLSLERALDDALANLSHAIERTGATIERDPLPELVAEKAGMIQLFQNLIGNAIKFHGDAAPVVRIGASQTHDAWTFTVTDNGIGIAPEYFQRIFVIFQRLHGRTKYEGTGIGLSICKKIVERHGGAITVDSEPGKGTTFRFTLRKSLEASP